MSDSPMTQEVLRRFEQISAIPRRSGDEEALRSWLIAWADEHGFGHEKDEIGNLVIRVPAAPGSEDAPMVALQGHLDMVCEKIPGSAHDFTKDPIRFDRRGDWLGAVETSLGADNGIAIAMAMVVAMMNDIKRPALELLFTIDEETGLTGATELSIPLQSKFLINIDSEDEGVVTVGCAGGLECKMALGVEREAFPAECTFLKVHAGGMSGGHSGVDIHHMRANAIRVLARSLELLADDHVVRLCRFDGGTAHNAIPRDAEAIILVPTSDVAEIKAQVEALSTRFAAEFSVSDPNLKISAEGCDVADAKSDKSLTLASTERALDFLMAIPHGVAAMSTDIQGLVETSNNEATAHLEEGLLRMSTSQRSSVVSRLEAHTRRIESICRLAGATCQRHGGYPPWQPNMSSALLARTQETYRSLFDKEPVVEVIHAGLECGIIGAKYPGMDMVSIGPTIRNPHSPDEELLVPTVEPVFNLLKAMLASFVE